MLLGEPGAVDDDVVLGVAAPVRGGVARDAATAPPRWNIAMYDRGEAAR